MRCIAAARCQWKMHDMPAWHFLNELVGGAAGLNGACVIALQDNTARNVRERRIIKTSTTDRLLMFFLLLLLYLLMWKGSWMAAVWPDPTQLLLNICRILNNVYKSSYYKNTILYYTCYIYFKMNRNTSLIEVAM